jgi:hypothetical protein
MVGVQDWKVSLPELDQSLLRAQLQRRLPRRLLDNGLGALLWAAARLGRDARSGWWCWLPHLPSDFGWLTLGLHVKSLRWWRNALIPGLGSSAWLESKPGGSPPSM